MINKHIVITLILHNMLSMWRDQWLDKDEAEEDDEVATEAVARLSVSQSAKSSIIFVELVLQQTINIIC